MGSINIASFFILLLLTGCGSGESGNTSDPSTFFLDYGVHEGDMIDVQILTFAGISQWSDTSGSSGSDAGYQKTAVVDAGTAIQLSAIGSDISGIRYNNIPVEWLSDNDSVAVVDNGTVTGKSRGEATITIMFSMEDGTVISDNIVVTVLPSPVAGKAWAASKVSLPQPIWDHASVIWNGYLYTAGGNAGCRIDLQTNQFSDCGFTKKVYYTTINPDGSIGPFSQTIYPLPRFLRGHSLLAYNGFLYVIGGIVQPFFPEPPYPDPTAFETVLNEKVYYTKINPDDGSIGEWKETTPLPPPSENTPPEKAGLFALSATAHTITNGGISNGYIYVTGGWSTVLVMNVRTVLIGSIDNTDGSIMPWIHNETSDLPYDLSKHASVTASVNGNDYLYIIGGNSGNIGSQKFHNEIYYAKIAGDGILAETESNGIPSVWKRASNILPVQLIDHAAISADRYIFVLGGRDGDGGQDKKDEKTPYNIYDKVYYYTIGDDGDLGAINRYSDLPTPLFHHAAAADINKMSGDINIYVTGGAGGNTELQENRKSSVYYLTGTP